MSRVKLDNGITYYMYPKLYTSLKKKVKETLIRKDKDYVMVIDGREGGGKSTLAAQIGKYVDPTLTLDRVCITPDEFRKAIVSARKGQCIIFDEAYRGLGSTGALTEVNKILKSMMMEMRQKNLFVIIVLPTFYLLERYVALWRAKCLIHVYERYGIRGYFKLYNSAKKQYLYNDPKSKRFFTYSLVKTRFKGRFYGKWVVGSEEEYRQKKAKAFKEGFKRTRNEKYMLQRNKLLWILYKEFDVTPKTATNLFKNFKMSLSTRQYERIVADFKQR